MNFYEACTFAAFFFAAGFAAAIGLGLVAVNHLLRLAVHGSRRPRPKHFHEETPMAKAPSRSPMPSKKNSSSKGGPKPSFGGRSMGGGKSGC